MKKTILVLSIATLGFGCSNPFSQSKYDAPSSHTISKDGAMHMPGLTDPTNNCTGCHGDDLRGGDVAAVSCYECHSKKW